MDPYLTKWLPISAAAKHEDASAREFYWAIDQGMPHSRIGRRIRVRIADWRSWHEAHVVGGNS